MSNLVKLKFRIASFTSEDNEFPVSELLKPGPQSKGWQSARFQDFPQTIIFQFICPVQIKQLQFLSHQSKISSRVEIFTYIPENLSAMPPIDQFKWKRLGYLSLDSNEKSNYQARELKSVFIDAKAMFLKISLNKCHANKHNMFNQVGLIAVNALGEELADYFSSTRKGFGGGLDFDPVTSEKLKQLLIAKDRAVENEDFDEAKRLREAIERLKSLAQQLFQLEERKKIAINNEDYDSAKVIKMEVERLRSAIMMPSENPAFYARPQSSGQPMGMTRPTSRPVPVYQAPQTAPSAEFDSYTPVRPIKNDPYVNQEIMSSRTQGGFSNKNPISYEERVIPAIASGKNQKPMYDEDDDEEGPKNVNKAPEPLGPQQAKLAGPFIHILTEELCKCLFSRTWQLREEGLDKIMNEVTGSTSEILIDLEDFEIYLGVLGAVRHTIGDKVAQVVLKSMSLLNLLIKSIPPSRGFIRGDISEFIQAILAVLLDKIGDSNARVRELAEQTYMTLSHSEIVGINLSVQTILKPSKEKSISQKHILGKLNLLTIIIEEFRIDNSNVPFHPVVEYAIISFSNSNSEIRSSAQNLLMKIYCVVGSKLLNLIAENKSLRPAQIDTLNKGFSELETGAYQEPKAPSRQPVRNDREIRETKDYREQKPNIAMCEFCGKNDSSFAKQDALDIHYWKDCPMLVACLQCSQVVEVLHLNLHMLRECELSELVDQCPRCKEAINLDDFEMHVEEQACLAAKPIAKANRCPLCHDDVEPGQNGWIRHMLKEGCPNNDRSNY